MALDDLIARLEQDADAQVDALSRAADAEVTAIGVATAQALQARAQQRLGAERASRHAAFQRELADRRRAARAHELAARHATIDRVFARALALLPDALRSGPWARVWAAVAREAVSYVPESGCRVRCDPALAVHIRGALDHDPRVVVVEDEQVGPGLMVDALDGSVTVDATLPTCLAQRRPTLAIGLLPEDGRDA